MSATLDALGAETFWVERPSRLVGQVRLRVCRIPAKGDGPRNTLLMLHGYTEFLEKYAIEVFGRMQAMGYTVWSFDWRGQGLSTRLTGDPMRGHVLSLDDHLDDAKAIVHMMAERDGGDVVLVGHSMGGHLALRLLAEKPEPFRHGVILSPMIGIRTNGLPVAVARGLLALFSGMGLAKRYPPGVPPTDPLDRKFENNILTTDQRRFHAVRDTMRDNPKLRIGAPTIGWAAAAFRSIATLSRPDYLARIETPMRMFLSGNDRVVDNEAARRLVNFIPNADLIEVAGAEHELLMETDDRQVPVWTYLEELTK
ncbi:MAG: alpha/beta hydrolase [Alphaproteobacteria bacterium]|nr:alpha/beta hydrolase [Alphaproteobacteria bacterium]